MQSVGAECFGSGFPLLVSLAFPSRFLQRLHEQRAVFGIFWFALGGFPESDSSRREIAGLQSKQAEVKRIVVLIGIEIGGTTKVGQGLGDFAAACAGNRKVVQNFG